MTANASQTGHHVEAARPVGKMPSPHEAMGHRGHAAMSMDAMVKDMRNRFLVRAEDKVRQAPEGCCVSCSVFSCLAVGLPIR